MKPIQLVLSGLHSYREKQVIDFETLTEAGLFGIFGPTGSGKSTILDAITLALYGQVVRMGGTSHPQQVLNQLEDRLYVSFTFELGKGEACRRYTIEREFGIDKKGNKRQPEVRLIQRGHVDGEADYVMESKATMATQAVEKLIGLTIHDFTRAVVLPQGQFSKFLTLKGSERNEMLQRIFHLHEYGEKLNERIRALADSNKTELHQLELELAKLGEAGPEALLAAATELEAVQQQEQALRSQFEQLQGRKQEMEQLRSLQEELDKVNQRLQELQQEEARIQAVHKRIQEIEASIQLWPLIEKLGKLEAENVQTNQTLQTLRVQRQEATSRYEAQESAYQEALLLLRSEEPVLIEQKSLLTQAQEWERELTDGKQAITTLQQEIRENQATESQLSLQLETNLKQLQKWEQELAQVEGQIRQLAVSPEVRKQSQLMLDAKKSWLREAKNHTEQLQESERLSHQLKGLAQQLKQFEQIWLDAAKKRKQLELAWQELQAQPVPSDQELEDLRESLSQVKTIGKEWRELDQTESSLKEKQEEWQKQWSVCEQAIQQLAQQIAEQEKLRQDKLSLKQEAENRMREWHTANMAAALRSSLKHGEACPVCGSCEHSIGADDHQFEQFAHQEDEWKQRIELAEQMLLDVEKVLEASKEQMQALRVQEAGLRQREAGLQEEKQGLGSRYTSIQEQLKQLGENWVVEEIAHLIARFQQADQDWKEKAAHKDEHKRQSDELQQALVLLREQELTNKADYDKQAAILAQLELQVGAIQERVIQAETLAAEAETRLHEVRAEIPVEGIEGYCESLEKREADFDKQQQLYQQLTEQIRELQNQMQQSKMKQTEQVSTLAFLNKQLVEKQTVQEKKKQQWLERTGGIPAATRLLELEQKLETYRSSLEAKEKSKSEALEMKQRLHEDLLKLEESALQIERQRNEALLAVEQALLRTGLPDVGQVERIYQEREQLPDFKQQVLNHQTALTQLHYDQQRLMEKLEGRIVDPAEWEALLIGWQEIDSAWSTIKEQVVLAARQVAVIQTNHQRWLEVHQRYEEITNEQSRLDDLRKLFEAKAFVQFIAEEKMTSIARDASYHLARMTKNRYALEIGAEGEFILRDEAAGGHKRSVSTLSGGETFLTSLALALALSVEIQMRGSRLEFFFLDEGFGTLDPELLEVVLDALDRLRMDDFAIGLISHVPEIKERMPRRLVITPAEPMGRGSLIELEIE